MRLNNRIYEKAKILAARETGLPLDTFPEACPLEWRDVLSASIPFDSIEED